MSIDRAHDVEIVDSKGKKYGFMLAGEGGQKNYEVRDLSLLPPSLVTGEATYASMSPEQKILLEATDWRRGIQDEIYETAGKYYKASDCDLRFKGKAMLPPKELTAIAIPASFSPAFPDLDLETWTDDTLTYWALTGDVEYLWKTNDKYHGSWGGRYQGAGVPTAATLTDEATNWTTDWQSRWVVASIYGKVSNVDASNWVRIGINDGISATTWSSKATTTSWTKVSVIKQLASNATQIQLIIDLSAGASDAYYTYFDYIEIEGLGGGSAKKQVNFGDDIVVASGKLLGTITSGSWATKQAFLNTITDLCVFGNYLCIALGWSTKYYYTSNLSSFSQTGVADSTAKYMSNIGNSQFWISDTANTLRTTANAAGGSFTADPGYVLPNSAWDITGLVDDTSVVYVRKEDQVYYLSNSNVYSLIPDLVAEASTTHSYGIFPWKGNLYLPSGVNSLYEYNDGTVTVLSPCRYAQGDTDLDGKVLAITSDQECLYIAVENGTKIEILAGHWEVIGGSTTWNWHWLYEKTSNDVTCALISAVSGSKRFYLGTNTASDGILNYKIPVSYSDPLKESSYEVQSSGDFITPWLTTNFATTDKLWPCIRVTSLNFKSDTTIRVYYQKKGDDDWTALGYCTQNDYTSVASPWSFTYPDEATDKFDIGVVSERIRFKFALATTTDELSPIIKGYSVECRLVPLMSGEFAGKVEIELTIKAADNLQNLAGVTEPTRMDSILKDIEILKQEALPFTITGPDQETYTVRFSPRGSKRKPYIDEKTRHPEFWVSCLLGEV